MTDAHEQTEQNTELHTQEAEAPAEVKAVLPHLEGEELDEDALLDAEEDDGEFIDAGELFAMLSKLQETLDEQGKEIRGLRREMRELREQQGQSAPREGGREGGFQRDGGQRGGYQGGGFRDRDNGGRDGGRDGGFRPREGGFQRDGQRGERGGYQGGGFRGDRDNGGRDGGRDGGFRPREGGFQRDSGQRGGYQGGGFRDRDNGGRDGGRDGGFRSREGGFQRDGGSQGSGGSYQGDRSPRRDEGNDFRPRARRDMGWGGKRDNNE